MRIIHLFGQNNIIINYIYGRNKRHERGTGGEDHIDTLSRPQLLLYIKRSCGRSALSTVGQNEDRGEAEKHGELAQPDTQWAAVAAAEDRSLGACRSPQEDKFQ